MHAEHPTVTRHPQHKAGGRGETHRVRSGERRSAVWWQNTNPSRASWPMHTHPTPSSSSKGCGDLPTKRGVRGLAGAEVRGVDDPWLDLEARDEGVAEKGQIAAVLSRTWTVYAGHERMRAHRAVRRGVGSVALCPLDMNRRSRRVRSKEARRHTAASRGARPAERRLVQGTFVALPYTAVQKQQRPPPARLASGGGARDRMRAVCVRAGKGVRVSDVRVGRPFERSLMRLF